MEKRLIPGIPDELAKKIFQLLETNPAIKEVLLFGSRAKGNYREGSDIDLALKGTTLTIEDRDKLLLGYDDLYLPWKLDLVIYHLIQEPALKEHIDRAGKPI